MLELLRGVPLQVWVLVALLVLVPLAGSLLARATPLGRRFGLATRITSRALSMMGFGFGVMALVATLAVLQTGLQEIRQRHLPTIVDLAAEMSGGHARAPDSVSYGRTLSLFRALEPEVGPVAIWGESCGERCLSLATDPDQRAAAEVWAHRMIERPAGGSPLQTTTIDGEMHLVITTVLRDISGTPEGHVAVAVRAGWVADRALRTALALVVLAYVLLLVAGWATRGMLAATVASRVQEIAKRLRGTATTHPLLTPPDARDELAVLDHAVGAHVVETVERLREADQRATEARALAARMEATTTLAAGVAHDFSNLMSGVMANCELLRLDVGGDQEALHTLDTILECAYRGGRLAQQLVAFARGGKYQPTIVDVNAVIEETLRVEAHGLTPDIQMTRDLAPNLLRVEADPVQLTQVVSNLHRNAVEAMRHAGGAGSVTFRTRNVTHADGEAGALPGLPPGPYVALTVADSGPGMSDETRERIFEPFFTTKEGGRGMGLAATYGIVTHHGGSITVHSAKGRGTTFVVHLPATTAQAVPAERQPAGRPAGATGVTLLLVDDEVAILSGTRRLLERHGYTVLTAESGPEALQLAEHAAGPIDVILLDLRMPGTSGSEVFQPLSDARPNACIIICSGYELDAHAQTLLDRGAAAFVRKPFRLDELRAAITGALERAR